MRAAALEHQQEIVRRSPLLVELLDTLPNGIVILNDQREVVAANAAFYRVTGKSGSEVLGRLPGDALNCINADTRPSGCGSSPACRYCGLTQSIRDSCGTRKKVVRDCRVREKDGAACLDLRVTATPLQLKGERLTVCAIEDISHEKRRGALERVFFHDVRNTLSALMASADLLQLDAPESCSDLAQDVCDLVERLHLEIRSQKVLLEAERGSLRVAFVEANSETIIEDVRRSCHKIESARDRPILVGSDSQGVFFETDAVLVGRVLGNMLQNALEASGPDQEVRLGSAPKDGGVEFWTWNAGGMAREAAAQVFQRSFSTKGADRGLGTYSIKLLAETYLGGKVTFETSGEAGTTFRAWFPLRRRHPAQ